MGNDARRLRVCRRRHALRQATSKSCNLQRLIATSSAEKSAAGRKAGGVLSCRAMIAFHPITQRCRKGFDPRPTLRHASDEVLAVGGFEGPPLQKRAAPGVGGSTQRWLLMLFCAGFTRGLPWCRVELIECLGKPQQKWRLWSLTESPRQLPALLSFNSR